MILYIEIVCPKDIPNGELSDSCGRKVGDACTNFTCNYGYERNEEPVFLNCTESGSWTNNLSLLCTGLIRKLITTILKLNNIVLS